MKKKQFFFLSILLIPIGIISVYALTPSKKPFLTYGRSSHDKNEGLIQLTYGEFEKRMDKKDGEFSKETFLLLVTDKNSTCICGSESRICMNNIIQSKGIACYHMDLSDFDGNNKYGVKARVGEAHLNIISCGKVIKDIKSRDIILHEGGEEETYQEICQFVKVNNNLKYCTRERLEDAIANKETFSVEYIWRDCGDCSYINPNYLWNYSSKHVFNSTFYIVDLADLVNGKKENSTYIKYLNNYHLNYSSDNTYGYSTGKVPTIHHYTSGVLDDAAIIFNETFEKIDDAWRITDAFYDAARINKVKYLNASTYEPIVNKIYKNKSHSLRLPYYSNIMDQYLAFYTR